jgi:hypothetical protein
MVEAAVGAAKSAPVRISPGAMEDSFTSPAFEAAKKMGYREPFFAYVISPAGFEGGMRDVITGKLTAADSNLKTGSILTDAAAVQMTMNASADAVFNKKLSYAARDITAPWGLVAAENGFKISSRTSELTLKIYAAAATDEKNLASTNPVGVTVGNQALKVKLSPAGAMLASHASTLTALAANPEDAMGAKVQTNEQLKPLIQNCLDFNNPKISAALRTIGHCSDVGATAAYRGIQENVQKAASLSR